MMLREEIIDHSTECTHKMVECERCNSNYRRDQKEQHDCVIFLKSKITFMENMVSNLTDKMYDIEKENEDFKTEMQNTIQAQLKSALEHLGKKEPGNAFKPNSHIPPALVNQIGGFGKSKFS